MALNRRFSTCNHNGVAGRLKSLKKQYGVFFSCGLIGVSFLQLHKSNRYWLVITTFIAATGAALAIIIWQFASYTGFDQLLNYWRIRFTNRSLVEQKSHLPDNIMNIAAHMATSYLPAILFMLLLFLSLRISRTKLSLSRPAIMMLIILSSSLVAYNIVFLEWSSEHEFAVIPYALLFACAATFLLQQTILSGMHKLVFGIAMLLSIAQYYYINRPGHISMHKIPYPDYHQLGTRIKEFARPGHAIFLHGEVSPMTEYYAGRTLHFVKDYKEAWRQIRASGITRSMWIEYRNYNITHVRYIMR